MRKVILILFGSMFHALGFGQQQEILPVVLNNVMGSAPFYPSQTFTQLTDTRGFQGVPDTLKAYKIKEVNLSSAKEKLFILYGITKQDKRLVLFDADFDRNFAGEQVFLFGYDGRYDRSREKAVLDSINAVEIRFPNAPPIHVKPGVYNCCVTYKDSLASSWHLFVRASYHREGEFSINGQAYKIAISGSYTPFFSGEQARFFVQPAHRQFETESNSNQPYTYKSTASVNGHEFIMVSLSRFGDTAWLQYNGYKEKAQGNKAGLYAQNIIAKAIDKELFDLRKLRGKYVLLDFWGTWCQPCIALLPELRQLNQKYNVKGLVLVSVANDKKVSYGKLIKMVKDQRMNWINLFDNQDLKGSIARRYEVECFPTSILINPDGKIIFRGCGTEDFDELKKQLAEVMQ